MAESLTASAVTPAVGLEWIKVARERAEEAYSDDREARWRQW
jgi:hypothetical protein